MEDYIMKMCHFDDEKQSLYYEIGVCSLKTFRDYCKNNGIKWYKK